MAISLKIVQATIDGIPYGCPECGSAAFTLDGHWLDGSPARGNCPNSHSWENPLIDSADLKRIKAASSGRQRIEDEDTFEITIGGAVLAGVLYPELTPEDVKAVGRIYWRKLIKPALRKQKRRAVRAVTSPIKQAARNGVAAAQAGALEAAWTTQAGGYEPDPDYAPEPINPCPACRGKGHHAIESRLHTTTTVRCSVCHGTGEID
ncbi:zinc finger-like domain-containing protein [Streptomyces sp. M2CJ-2]|uniref:zinc finger-like domain-containing protein n=1 Tax=Streptomyces sp. M2CJ-2 TaxID=2803948 RepID=UPI0019247AAD|nr:zinc finger-like domain-containing protein [Streptomyces sp. M2CJ-2]MBL3664499.1 zinc finger-like domain-containing protein [Streptomyces sp. M2CJ-2]